MDDRKYFSRIEEFTDYPTAKFMIISALKEILPRKGGRFAFFISFILGILFSIKIGIDDKTVILTLSAIQTILNVLLAIFACIFAVYSILLAFLSDSYIKKLLKIDYENNTSYLKTSTTYFEGVLFLYFVAIGITGVLLLFLNCIDPMYVLTSNQMLNNSLAATLLTLYFTFVFRVFYEVKSTIYNTIILFRASIAYKILAIAQSEKEGCNDDNNK